MTQKATVSDDIIVPSKEEAWAMFDGRARERLGISGEAFLEAWDCGEYREPAHPQHSDAMHLSMLIPFVRDCGRPDAS